MPLRRSCGCRILEGVSRGGQVRGGRGRNKEISDQVIREDPAQHGSVTKDLPTSCWEEQLGR